MTTFKLYDYWRSSSAWRVRWGLFLKGLEFESISIPLLEKTQYSNEHLARNPRGKVPTLEFVQGGKTIHLSESIAILEWLEETHDGHKLLPEDPLDRAVVRQLVQTVNSGIQPLQNLNVLHKVSDDKSAQRDWARHFIADGLKAYEKLVSKTAGEFSFGDEVTMADLCLIPQVYNAKRQEMDLEGLPFIRQIWENALKTPACQKSHPDSFQPQTSQ